MNLQAGKPVTGKDLIGREKEISLMMTLLRQGQSVVLVAPRRFGKTSLVLEVISRLKKEHYYTACIDIFSVPDIRHLSEQITENVLANKKLDAVFRKLGKNIGSVLKNLEFKQVIEDFEFVLKYTTPLTDEWELLSDSIDFTEQFSLKNDRRIVCALDEFGDISKLDGDRIVKLFRSRIQMQQNSTYIFSGSSESMMDALFVKKNAPFYRLTRIIELGNIPENDFRDYLNRSFAEIKITAPDAFADDILRFTKGHPYYTQLILQQVYISSHLNPQNFKLELPIILDELLVTERNYLEKLWEEFSRRREYRVIITTLAEEPETLYSKIDHKSINIPRTIRALKGAGHIIKNPEGRYILSDPLFAYWIRKNVLKSSGIVMIKR